ncbi:hypothetical protein Cgig2_029370 [Carnegiea gigantea]|uniref:Uncharacterized protein n=1 Tax=Carnegiea gigantea TaxID=171969 RepID=A0A9Q1KUX0_9CARY|nr:hypothetical protein Cgig2_029370 [Carnegiea gigantea]
MEFQFEFEEEFQESDVIFSDDYSSSDQSAGANRRDSCRRNSRRSKSKKMNEQRRSSVPVNIPSSSSSPSSSPRFNCNFNDFDDGDIVPPHVIVDRRTMEDRIACSFNSFDRNVVMRGRNLIQSKSRSPVPQKRMDFEEFQESDVIFSSDYSWDQINSSENGCNGIHRHRHGQWKSLSLPRNDNKTKEKQQRMISSSPIPQKMDFEEFQESDILFSSDHSWNQISGGGNGQWKSLSLPRNDKKKKKMKQQQQRMINSSPMSVPVNIPVGMGSRRYDIDVAGGEPFDQSSDEDHDDGDDEIMDRMPPHLIVERRVSGEIARSFSPLKVCYLDMQR